MKSKKKPINQQIYESITRYMLLFKLIIYKSSKLVFRNEKKDVNKIIEFIKICFILFIGYLILFLILLICIIFLLFFHIRESKNSYSYQNKRKIFI